MQQTLAHFEAFLLTQKCVAHNTFTAYQRDVTQFVQSMQAQGIGDFSILTATHITTFLTELQSRNISARSVARKISALRLFFNYAKNHRGHTLHDISLILPQLPQTLPLYCSPEEIASLLQASCHDTTPKGKRNSVILHLLYASGIRVSELTELCITDIHFDTGILNIRGKGGKVRAVPLVQEMLTLLRWYVQSIQATISKKKKSKPLLDTYLFSTCYGKTIKPLSRQTVWKMIKDLLKKTFITKDVSPHTFRHSLATHGLQQGWDLRSLQLLLGHENISTVEIYTHVEISHLRKAYDKKHPRS